MKKIIESIKSACKDISYLLRNYISNRRSSKLYNSSGDNVNTIDLVANDIIKEYLRNCTNIKMIASEEEEELITIRFDGDYFVVFDPLDGSKNIDNNLVTGTIFGIFKLNGKEIDDIHGYDLVY